MSGASGGERRLGGGADETALMLVVVPWVLSRGEATVDEIAAEFDVPAAAVRRLVEQLTLVGRPSEGGWSMPQDMFDIDWDALDEEGIVRITNVPALDRAPRLTAREAAALLAGLQVVAALPGVGDSPSFARLTRTLSRGANAQPTEILVAPSPGDEDRRVLADAIARGVAVRFSYKTPDGPALERTVDPYRLQVADGQWYLRGWDHLREDARTFHLERMSDVAATGAAVGHTASDDDADGGGTADAAEGRARVRFPAALRSLVGAYLNRAEEEETRGGDIVATLRVADASSLRRIAARLGGALEVLSPPEARRAVAEWAAAGLNQSEQEGRGVD